MGISHLKFTGLAEHIGNLLISTPAAESSPSLLGRSLCLMEARAFKSYLSFERRRAERSRRAFVLMLLDVSKLLSNGSGERSLGQIAAALASCTRETDLIGWYESRATLGIIFTEIGPASMSYALEPLRTKIVKALQNELGPEQAKHVAISVHLFPRPMDDGDSGSLVDWKLYPDMEVRDNRNRAALAIKRVLDFVASGLFLIVFSPLFAVIALAIKLFSKGPVLFKQERLGQFGTRFQVLKFRTMYVNNDPRIHKEYAERLISGKDDPDQRINGNKAIYKLTNDPRVTAVGRWLRKTSLDELPQFWNVLRGDMSLVGPRPPVLYEFEKYDFWHRRRVVEVKPGITGLWQISGRSTTKFDDMVRLDLQYYRSWSIWLDIKILLRTPFAVIFGDGAY
jgi:exopolysaccharide biosynthesis polyprenyl glycosylphosphotransferase